MTLIEAVKKYFHGESKDEKVRLFEEYDSTINKSRDAINELTGDLIGIINGVDIVKASTNEIMNGASVNQDNVEIALDNLKFSNASLSNYIGKYSHEFANHKLALEKAEKGMMRLIADNQDIAKIIADVKHDDNLEKALDTVFEEFKEGNIEKQMAVTAYKNAVSSRRTDRDLSKVLDKYLKDSNGK